MRESPRELRARWQDGDRAAARGAALQRLRVGGRFDDLRLGEHDRRVDLRGLALPAPDVLRHLAAGATVVAEATGFFEPRDVTWNRLDLAHSTLDGLQAAGLTIRDCRFEGASFGNARLWRSEIVDSILDRADLRVTGLGWSAGRGPSRFTRTSFRGADLRDGGWPAVVFVDCDFSYARLQKTAFGASRFERCRFAGELRETIFDSVDLIDKGRGELEEVDLGNELRDCDFRDAILRWTDFRRLDLRTVALPNDPDLVVVGHYPCVIRRLLRRPDLLETPFGPGLCAVLEHDRKWLHPKRRVGLFHRADWGEEGDSEEMERLLRAVEAECAAQERSPLRRLLRR